MNPNSDQNFSTRPLEGALPVELDYQKAFYDLKEIEEWFDKNFCGIDHVMIVAPGVNELNVQTRARSLGAAISPYRMRKAAWLRQDGNEAWYGPRVALVHSTWDVLKVRHDEVVSELHQRRRKVEQELEHQKEKNAELQRAFDALSESWQQRRQKMVASRATIARVLAELPASLKKLLPKKVVEALKLAATDLQD